MKKKVFSLMMMLLLAVTGFVRANELTVHDGTATNSYVPVYGFYADAYLKCEMVYPASELSVMSGGEISSLTFGISSPASEAWTATFQVFVKEVNGATISDFSGTAGATTVYTGTLDGTGSTMTVNFTAPYTYNGGDLLVGFYLTTTGNYKSITWAGETVTGASVQGYSYSGLDAISASQRNFLPKTTFTYTGGGGGGGSVDQLHVKYMDGDVEVIDELNLGVRPADAWMEPFDFTMYTEGATYTVNVLDFTPSDGMFTVAGEELPFQVVHNEDVALNMMTNGTEAGVIERQFVAITEGDRAAHIWPVTVELYAPEIPDVWEKACTEATTFPFVEVPATAHNTVLHNDYTLPFPEIPEGVDAVYKLVFDHDQMLSANVSVGEDGKVALYREGFEGEGGPMATNYYTGAEITGGGGAAAAPFEAQIGEGTSTTGYFPFYTLYNYSIAENLFLASELEAAGVTTAPMSSLSWYATNTTGYNQQGITIWMANVNDETLTTTSHVVTGMTKVYTGAMTPLVGWNEFVFNEGSFAWDGHSNILIFCQRNNGAWNSTISWQATPSMPFNAMAYRYQDSGAYDETIPNTMYTSTTRPNIIMKSAGRRDLPVLSTSTNNSGVNTNASLNREGWMYYDNGTYGTSIGVGGGVVYWGSMFPASMLTENRLTKVALYENSYNVDPITLYVYQGGTTAPGTQIYTQIITPVGGDAFHEVTLSSPVTIDPSQNLWIVFSENGTYPANACAGSSYPNNRWVSLDGAAWYDVADLGVPGYEWMIRAYLANNAPVPPTPPTPGTVVEYNAGPVIEDLPVLPGTYYLVASSTTPDFEVTINAEEMPCPPIEDFVFAPIPADDADEIEPASVTLTWSIPAYATGWRLVFGSTYHPDPNHPQTVRYPADGSFTRTMANSYTVRNLWNNTNYFWHVEFNNDGCPDGVSSPIWGFTTHLNVPQNLRAADETVFNDENITLTWNPVVDRTYRKYYVYCDDVLVDSTQVNNISLTTCTLAPMAYNMNGYNFYVTAVYDEGESAHSNTVNVKVSGRGNVEGHVYEQDGTTGIAGATVTMTGLDEFGVSHTYNFQTNNQGYYSGAVYAGSYNGQAACNGYQTIDEPVQGNPIGITYNVMTSPIDYILDENFDPVCTVIAQYYPDSTDINAPYVKVYWGCGLPGEEIIEDFETGDFSKFDWQLDNNYPWSITTNNPYEGTYCMKSGGAGVASVTSNMTVTVNIPADGEMTFFSKISSEANYDYGKFYIDNVQMGQYSGQGSWGERRFNVTAGDHTFQWRYTKDSSVNSYDDCFYVDYITFYKRPEPAQPGWHTYLESDFDNAYRSNVGDPSWGYEYPVSIASQFAGWNLTKVAVFSDNMYNAVGGNFTCNVYVGGTTPAAGTLASTITVDVPVGLGAWCEYDLTTPVNVTGNDPIWVIWTVNSYGSSLGYPAGCASHASQYGDWWNNGQDGWDHMGTATWTMKNYFTNRAGRTVALGTADAVRPAAVTSNVNLSSNLRTYVKGQEDNTAECINPHATLVPMTSVNTNERAFSHYRVYRTNCYNDGPYTLDNTVVLACELHDTLYIDVDWPDVAPGVYKWGVGCVYVGNRGEEIAGPIHWAQPTDGNRATLTYDFNDGTMGGWTTIDADGDGFDWEVAATLDHQGNTYASVASASYDNTYGALTPNNFFVSPQVTLGGTISFWACAQDNAWAAEHFGVAVSTTSNTSASAFTTIQEWTMTAKGTRYSGPRGNRDQGNWYQYTADLSAYAGQTGYVAIRHFNSTDWFRLNVDDITIVEGSGTGPTPPTPPTPGTGDLQEPRESEIVWSLCLDKDMWLAENAVDITVLLNSADSPEGVTVSFTNLNEVEQQNYPVADVVLDETGFYAWDTFRKGDYQVSVTRDGYEPITENVSIWDPTSLRYVMIEIIYGVDNLYVSRTGWAMWEGHGEPGGGGGGGGQGGGQGDTFSVDFEAGMPSGWTTIDADGDGYNWMLASTGMGTGYGHNGSSDLILSQSYNNNVGALTPDNYLVSPAVNLAAGSTFSFWACAQDNAWASEHFGVAVSETGTGNWTMVQEWTMTAKGQGGKAGHSRDGGNRTQGNWYQYTVDLSAYAGTRYIAIRHFNCTDWFYLDVDDIALTNGSKDGERHLEYYKVMCESIDHEPIFNINTPHNFCQVATDELVEGEQYICKVAAVYSTGMSDYAECIWEYESCEHYAGTVNGLDVNGTTVTWDYPGSGTGPTPPVNGDTFSVDFESGMPAGWTTIDADGDGYNWMLGSTAMGTGYGHNGSSDLILSQSYNNNVGALTPDNYLVSPAVNLAAGSTFSFWACAQDNAWASEHFGVAVSETGTGNWTMVQEWTMTAKGQGGKAGHSRDGGNRTQGNWYQYTVDLSAYAGTRYIAIRHFNCTDWFYLDVDDIALTNGSKGNRAMWDLVHSFTGTSAGQQAVATDGNYIYTASWQSSPTGGHTFYQYTLDGTFVEGFEIPGATGIRDITTDGTYFYATSGGAQIFKLDLTGRTLVGTINCSGLTSRHISYDPVRNGLWCGNWSTLDLYDMNGAHIQSAAAPSSAYGSTYFVDDNNVEHLFLFCQPNSDAKVYDYNIATNTISSSPIFDFAATPGFDGIAGGCFIGQYDGRTCWFGNSQQDPNLIGIYELAAGTGPTPPPTPSGDILGAMVFLNGEWEAFVEAPTNTYTFDEPGEYCVRIVYNGTAQLPSNNFYYAMSCEECEGDTPGTCEPGDPIHAEVLHDTDQVRIWWGVEPAAPIEDWLYYDDGMNVDAIGLQNGGSFYWGIKFPAASLAQYEGCSVTKIGYFDYTAHTGVVRIYQGSNGNGPSNNMIGSYNYTANGTEDWVEWTIPAVAFDNTQDLWIVMNNTTGQYVAAMGNYTGDPNGTMLSTDGSTWYTLNEATGGAYEYTWNLRCFVTNQAKGNTEVVEMPLPTLEGGVIAKAGMSKQGDAPAYIPVRSQIVKYNVYRSDNANGTYTQIGEVAEAGQTLYEYFDTPETAGTYYYQVKAVYDDGCVSDPAAAADDPTHNYVSAYVDAIGENNDMVALYPNPTKDNVTIEANGMSRITVVSVLGQVVFDTELNANVYTLNMSQFNAGMYMVRIYTENGVTVKRVTVMQ